jgi:hypothetical protein
MDGFELFRQPNEQFLKDFEQRLTKFATIVRLGGNWNQRSPSSCDGRFGRTMPRPLRFEVGVDESLRSNLPLLITRTASRDPTSPLERAATWVLVGLCRTSQPPMKTAADSPWILPFY